MAVTGWFVALLAAGVVPVIVVGQATGNAWAPLGLWLAACVLLLVIDVSLAGSPRRLSILRELPERVRLGETVTSRLLVSNQGERTVRAVVRDAWQPSAGATEPRQRVVLPPGERRAARQRLTPFRRGDRTSSHVTVRSFGPLRLGARQATLSAPGRLRVLPPFNARKHLPSRLARLRELDGASPVMVRGQGTEFDSLREYVRGDDVRSIDWRATARRQDLVVRTWRPERDRRVVIIIDTGRTSAARIDNEPRIDTAFESSLLLAALATRAGDRVDVVAFDRRVRGRVQGANGPALLARMVDTFAGIDPELIEMDWDAVPGQVRDITAHRALVVLLTSIDAPGASQGLLSVLPQLTQKHTVVVASVTDPDVEAAVSQRDRRDDVYRAASAERSLLDVARVSAAIRQQGADVVTGAPADLPPALSDHYIALKAAGRL
ncbi:DUF58 domain-containing protein [Paramicrobacterium agarici]|uniref:DUF58 domain-containing protein n=1 Tax=Paramicrobacterium agarici TaxID=630514 RepID=UPI0011540A3F|nr:DUF58 domain-containing protein [Microbacterium agarici]TQO23916.1 uncharacterized protein (DUF58 family) [Microbacterium agarici]